MIVGGIFEEIPEVILEGISGRIIGDNPDTILEGLLVGISGGIPLNIHGIIPVGTSFKKSNVRITTQLKIATKILKWIATKASLKGPGTVQKRFFRNILHELLQNFFQKLFQKFLRDSP